MIIRDILNEGANLISKVSDTARLDSSILLANILGYNRAKLLANYNETLPEETIIKFRDNINLRLEGFPISYIVNEKEFYGHNFYIETGVLIPRPDTEILIETAINLIEEYKLKTALDMCTGSGCISITLKKECPDLDIIATDISPISQKVFNINNNKLVNNKVNFIHSDLYTNLNSYKFDIIVTNPPYLTRKESDDRVVQGWKEPVLALDGGVDGLDLINEIISETPKHLNKNGWLIIEADPKQMKSMELKMIEHGFSNIKIVKDLASFDRIIVGRYE